MKLTREQLLQLQETSDIYAVHNVIEDLNAAEEEIEDGEYQVYAGKIAEQEAKAKLSELLPVCKEELLTQLKVVAPEQLSEFEGMSDKALLSLVEAVAEVVTEEEAEREAAENAKHAAMFKDVEF